MSKSAAIMLLRSLRGISEKGREVILEILFEDGDTLIGLIDKDEVEKAVTNLKQMGFKVIQKTNHILAHPT